MMDAKLAHKDFSFEFFLYKLIEWYRQSVPSDPQCVSLTRIKILKLLFFTSVIKTEDGHDLLDIFDNFYAMQHGPVESDIYNSISANQFRFYSFDGISLKLPSNITDESFHDLDDETKQNICNSLKELKKVNSRIVGYDPFKLVELSHQWNSWKRTYEVAGLMGKGREKMSLKLIKEDEQFFI